MQEVTGSIPVAAHCFCPFHKFWDFCHVALFAHCETAAEAKAGLYEPDKEGFAKDAHPNMLVFIGATVEVIMELSLRETHTNYSFFQQLSFFQI